MIVLMRFIFRRGIMLVMEWLWYHGRNYSTSVNLEKMYK